MSPEIFLGICCLLVVASSIIGGMVLASTRITHTRLQLFVSLIAGLMLGVALLHLLPMAVYKVPDTKWAFIAALLGLLVMFFLVRIFDCHEHSSIEADDEHSHDHCDHGHADVHQPNSGNSGTATWIGLAVGLSIHSILDGFALAAAVNAESAHAVQWGGLGIALAVALHKPLDSMMITSMMIAQGSTRKTIWIANILFAVTCPVGAVMLWIGLAESNLQDWILGIALAFSAGVFLCISLGDLLPELHFHKHDRFKLSAMLLLGVAIAIGMESMHTHEPSDLGQQIKDDDSANQNLSPEKMNQ